MNPTPITSRGYQTLKEELKHLKSVERPQNIKAIEEARAHGDLSENAEFEAAKDRQKYLDFRIGDLEYKLCNAEVIDPDSMPKDRALFGCTIILENTMTAEEVEYQLVGQDESNIAQGRISVVSPLGNAIIGKKPGDEIVLQTPGGKRIYEIVEIK